MTPDHLFVDSMGNRSRGAETMHQAWIGYFAIVSEFRIEIDTLVAEGGTVLAAGEAGGTIDETAWHTPAAWKAIIRDGAVSEWRVFADNKPVYEILAKRTK
jgi:ketosteroid isomerase-like protein